MKTGLQRIVFVLVSILALSGGYLLGLRQHDHDHGSATTADSQEHKVQYTCSMHPFIIRDEPGSCPICGMALTPLKSGETGGAKEGGIVIDPTHPTEYGGTDRAGRQASP